jgi:hypothetical protein
LEIIIHTYGRATLAQQHTLQALLADGIKPWLCVQDREKDKYEWYEGPLIVLPPHITTLAPTRDWLIHEWPEGDNEVVFLDDDLAFFVRRDDDRTKFRKLVKGDLTAMFDYMRKCLSPDNEGYPHVGIAPREGGNRLTDHSYPNTRLMRVLGYRRDYLRHHKITFAPMVVMEDFSVNLQVLRSGEDSLMLNNWCSNQVGGSDAPGGCSTYRTSQVQNDSAHLLAKIHAPFVRVVEKTTKGAWGGGTRTDVVVSWKAARRSADK